MDVHRSHEPGYAGGHTFQKVPLVLDPAGLADADVAIVGAPMDEYVTFRPGARFGPREIRLGYDAGGPPVAWHMGLGVDPFAALRIVDFGDAEVTPGAPDRSHEAIRTAVSSVVSAGAVPVVLGGDHSISYPAIAAVAAGAGNEHLTIVHFDTHADTATENWGVQRAHGTPFRHLVDEGVIRGDRLIQVGLRGYWPLPEEFDWMRAAGVHWYRMDDVIERGITEVVTDLLQRVDVGTKVYLSVDIDVLDPAFAPGTGTPEPGGMSTRELLLAVRRLCIARDLAGMDVVEVSPPYDHAGITAMAAHRTILEALAALAVRQRGGEAAPEEPVS